MKLKNSLIGKKFGMLHVIKVKRKRRKSGSSFIQYTCICDCGAYKQYEYGYLVKHTPYSCGCVKRNVYSNYLDFVDYFKADLLSDIEYLESIFHFSKFKY